MEKRKFSLAIFMVFIIGMMNAYTYILRDATFASMQTGNIIKACIAVSEGNFFDLHLYLLPVFFFVLGIIIHASISDYKYGKIICWSLLTASYIAGLFIPYGRLDFIAVAVLSLGVGIQIQSIRKVNGVDVATTMCTGSIRSMTEKIVKYIKTKDRSLFLGIVTYFCIVVTFTSGVIISAFIIKAL